MDQLKINLMLRVAKMYYELNMGQQDIADKENISKSTVSRLLKNAMDEGYVEVRVKAPVCSVAGLEAALTERFGLRKAVVVPDVTGSDRILIQDAAQALSEDLPKYIADHDVVGVAWECTLDSLIPLFPKMHRKGVMIVQLNGSAAHLLKEAGATEVIRALKQATEGEAYLLPAPAIVDSPRIAQALMEDSQIASVLEMARRCRTLIFSPEGMGEDSMLYELGCFTPLEYRGIARKGAAGDICSHFIDLQGHIVDPVLDARVIGIAPEEIKTIENKLMIAVGTGKTEAVYGALKGGFADVVYLDEHLANAVLAL